MVGTIPRECGRGYRLRAGFDGIEHCTFVTDFVDCDWATVDALAGSGIVVSVAEARLPSEPAPPAVARRLPTVLANWVEMLRRGVRVAISSDAGVGAVNPMTCCLTALSLSRTSG